MATILARRIDDTAREMMRVGVSLTWDEAGIVVRTTDETGVHFGVATAEAQP